MNEWGLGFILQFPFHGLPGHWEGFLGGSLAYFLILWVLYVLACSLVVSHGSIVGDVCNSKRWVDQDRSSGSTCNHNTFSSTWMLMS